MNNPWKIEGIVDALKENFANGYNARENADSLNRLFNTNITRAAIIGKCHRIGLIAKGATNLVDDAEDDVSMANITIFKKKKIEPLPDEKIDPNFDPFNGRFAKVKPWQLPEYGQCKYIIGNGETAFICTHQAKRNETHGFYSYCKYHHKHTHIRLKDEASKHAA